MSARLATALHERRQAGCNERAAAASSRPLFLRHSPDRLDELKPTVHMARRVACMKRVIVSADAMMRVRCGCETNKQKERKKTPRKKLCGARAKRALRFWTASRGFIRRRLLRLSHQCAAPSRNRIIHDQLFKAKCMGSNTRGTRLNRLNRRRIKQKTERTSLRSQIRLSANQQQTALQPQ